MHFDPEAELPGAPDPWAPSEMPARRDGPPYLMTEMIVAEPALAERLVGRTRSQAELGRVAAAITNAARRRDAIVTTGCGTSEHAAMAIAALLADALRVAGVDGAPVSSAQAFELAGRPPRAGVVLAVSHEGGTSATNEALGGAGAAGATTALITVSGRSPGAALAELVVTTEEQDQSWCHTVGYLSPLVAGAVLAAAIRDDPLDPIAVRDQLDAALDEASAEASAAGLSRCSRLLLVGSGMDYATARELALKVEEGAHLPATAHPLETLRHGHLAAADERTGLVLVLTDGEERGAPLLERATAVLRASAALGMPAAAILASDLADEVASELTTAGRSVVGLAAKLPRMTASTLATAIPLQLLTERLARARDVNPDTLGRDDPRQVAAADA
jgi:glutamine---fructose-6-phosphate transaminase (isomerizing)